VGFCFSGLPPLPPFGLRLPSAPAPRHFLAASPPPTGHDTFPAQFPGVAFGPSRQHAIPAIRRTN
jgi:hypothetical protein